KREADGGGAVGGVAAPPPAAIVMEGVDVPEATGERAFEERFAGGGGVVPPALRRPPAGVLVADRDADAAARRIAQLEIGGGGTRKDDAGQGQHQDAAKGASPPPQLKRRPG